MSSTKSGKDSFKKRMEYLRNMKDEDIDFSDIPELDDDFWKNARLEVIIKKKLLSVRLDEDIIDWFKSKGPGYQTHMNAVLRHYYMSKLTEEMGK
jgi:uncharacterized protein (DUF4415 family)